MFESNQYKVKQKALSIGNKYLVYENGEQILDSAQKKLRLKEDFRFKDMDGEPVLKVTTDKMLDIAASYTVEDERTGEPIGGIKEELSFFQHKWKVLDTEGKVIADIIEDNIALALVRRFVTTLVPFSYRIGTENGQLGSINGKLSLRDTYEITLSEDIDDVLDPRMIIAATVLIDAIESN
ncbi:LURP-one-related/scramblase family protein [Candidatus Nanohalococcus occultus]|uniref:LURP-one-related family protein n=1 Tax=Candidatus Nanohalococcus occultus TaxID=2978047 RepID=A0ABY8CCU5_9ARCH|nr:Uncharacterized protein SVXNc_0009 [Candidatus Nanohaloarchaeota archaeon SVXNc]